MLQVKSQIIGPSKKKLNSLLKLNISFKMIHIFSNIALIKLLGDTFQKIKFKMLFTFTMIKFMETILALKRQLQRFYRRVFIVLLFLMIHIFCSSCDGCQWMGKFSKRNIMSLNPILVVESFDAWGIDFMGSFPPSFRYLYILIAIDNVVFLVAGIVQAFSISSFLLHG